MAKAKTTKSAPAKKTKTESKKTSEALERKSVAAEKTKKEQAILAQAKAEVIAKAEAAAKAEEAAKAEAAAKASLPKQGSSLVKEDLSPNNATRERLITSYAPLIKYIAQRIAARLPANIELDDLISSGVIGLMDAIDKYDASRDNKFKTYAEFRIRGAILDELRSQDWVPRSIREKAKQLERVYAKLEQGLGRQATDEEVCAELKISTEEYFGMLNQVRSVSLLSFDDFVSFSKADKKSLQTASAGSGSLSTPFNEVSAAAVRKMISEAIHDLPEKQRLVLSLYYYEDLNLKEIGRVLDVTESRVSQLHTQAILRLKGKLRSHWDDLMVLVG